MQQPLIFSGSSHLTLASEVCSILKIPIGKIHIETFPDQEISIQILEDVNDKEVFVIQSIALKPHQYLMELLILIDALKRSSPKNITAIIPYFGYARQDRRDKIGAPITAKLIANLLTTAGISHLITFDLHADQIEGFFDIPVTHLHAQDLLSHHLRVEKNTIVVAPDLGSIRIAEVVAKKLHLDMAVIKKDRIDPLNVKTSLIGNVAEKNVLLVDDLCSTGETITAAAKLCQSQGALKITAAMTHGLFVGDAIEKIKESPLESLVITNTISQETHHSPKIQQISIASMIAQTIKNS